MTNFQLLNAAPPTISGLIEELFTWHVATTISESHWSRRAFANANPIKRDSPHVKELAFAWSAGAARRAMTEGTANRPTW
jgi:hypothetical protein